MIHITPDEKIIRIIRRHPWTFFVRGAFLIIALVLPLAFFIILDSSVPAFRYPLTNLYWIIYCIYALALFFSFLMMSVNYYLDFWVITNKKIIDVEFVSMFNHEVSEFPLRKIEDVTVHLQGLMPIFLNFGDVLIQTASETANFSMNQIPRPTETKDIIMGLITALHDEEETPSVHVGIEAKKAAIPLIP